MPTRPARVISTISRPGSNGYDAGPGYDLGSGIGSEQAENLLPFLSLFDLGPAVIASDPAQGQVVTTTPPTTFSLTFNEPIVPSSVEAADFTVNGTPADGDYLSPDDTTIYYTFTSSPVINQGVETMELPADSVIGANDGHYNARRFHFELLLCQHPAPGLGHQPAGGIDLHDSREHRSRRPVQRGDRSLRDQHERLPGQPGDGLERGAAYAEQRST